MTVSKKRGRQDTRSRIQIVSERAAVEDEERRAQKSNANSNDSNGSNSSSSSSNNVNNRKRKSNNDSDSDDDEDEDNIRQVVVRPHLVVKRNHVAPSLSLAATRKLTYEYISLSDASDHVNKLVSVYGVSNLDIFDGISL